MPRLTWNDFKIGKDANGHRLCRFCSSVIPKRRRSYCSNTCEHELRIRVDSTYIRHLLKARDNEVCSKCGLDTNKLRRILRHADLSYFKDGYGCYSVLLKHMSEHPKLKAWLKKFNFSTSLFVHLWEADHITAVADGGGHLGIENFQTLCLWCHKQKTKDMHQRKAKERKKQVDLF